MSDEEADKSFIALLVEDNTIIALDLEASLRAEGAAEILVAATVAEALSLLEARKVDVALVDVLLAGEPALAVAERLAALSVPFALSTGADAAMLSAAVFANRPVLSKPFMEDDLRKMLGVLLGRAAGA